MVLGPTDLNGLPQLVLGPTDLYGLAQMVLLVAGLQSVVIDGLVPLISALLQSE